MDFMRKKFLAVIAATCFLPAIASAAPAQQPGESGQDANAPAATRSAVRANSADMPVRTGSNEKPDKPVPPEQKNKSGIGATANPAAAGVHRFWDRENDLLFAAVAAGRGLDYASTINLRHRGINEALLTNSIVDNHPLFAAIEIGATAASVGVSYVFHRTGHHRLERWTSAIHAGIAVGGAIRNYNLKSAN
jgi:hypothetical protein